MTTLDLSYEDQALIEVAVQHVTGLFSPKHHRLSAVIKTKEGLVIKGVNVEGSFGCNDICAEQVVLGKALSDGIKDIETIVTVKHPKPEESDQTIKVANPCGKCRELLNDYAPNAWVVIRDGGTLMKVRVRELLPHRYSK